MKKLLFGFILIIMIGIIGVGAYSSLWRTTAEEVETYTTSASIVDFKFDDGLQLVGVRAEKIRGWLEVDNQTFNELKLGQEIQIKVTFIEHFGKIIEHTIEYVG